MLGGGGLVAANVYASATEGAWPGQSTVRTDQSGQGWASGGATIDCPDVGTRLTDVPEGAREAVDEQLAALDGQIAKAYQQVQASAQAGQQDESAVQSAIMDPLKEERAATIARIVDAIAGSGDRPEGLEDLAACTLRTSSGQGDGATPGQDQSGDGQNQSGDGQNQSGDGQNQSGDGQNQGQDPNQGQSQDPSPGQGQNQGGGQQQGGNGGQAGNGPVAADYADITTVQPNVPSPRDQADASTGTFSSACGVNANGLFNSDNVIVAPGVTNGAHHFHDYVGNQANNAFASDDDLAKGDTTCEDKGDRSTYYWPVLRLQNGTRERDADAPGGGTEGNAGRIVTPKQVTLTFVGSPRGKVTAMPRLLRIITGDAKAFVNGPANANASWSCTGFEDRQLKDKYPLCPQGSDVVRTFRFQSCWDGRNIDSANHRTHVAFADADGNCPAGFQAIPQLVQRIVYDVDAPSLQDGGRTTPLFAVDSFPEQLHKPVTDHGDFINVFDESLMREMVDCINGGRKCGAGAGQDSPPPSEDPQQSQQPQDPQQSQNPPDQPTSTPGATAGEGNGDTAGGGDDGGKGDTGDKGGNGGGTGDEQTTQPSAAETAGGDASSPPATVRPKAYTTPSASRTAEGAGAQGGSGGDVGGATQAPPPGAQAAPQTVGGSLAETGAQLWPAAAGALLVIAGFVLLRRIRRTGR
ncbi:DUF1996 domain-containing protein [Streptomyces sp. NPDC014864]|uniref:DUF1996 domain-containing protein n=1 Tax=Streptomyces sp. NPDC014864 TaxID=3364924 RepID=UPI0036FA6DE5